MSFNPGPPPVFPNVVPTGVATQHIYFNQGPYPVRPVIWRACPKFGYEDDTVTIIGLGFSPTQLPANGIKLWMDTQSDLLRPDIEPEGQVFSQVAKDPVKPPQIGTRNTTTIPHDKVTFTVTSAMVFATPEENELYFESVYGRSNRFAYTTYPRYAVAIPSTPPINSSKTVTRIDVTVPWSDLITEDYVSFTTLEYVVSGPYPERPPEHLVNLQSYATVSGDASTSGYDDPVDVNLHFTNRFRPDDTKVESRPDLGTLASTWVPNGAAPQRLLWYLPTAPYIDENVRLTTRTAPVVRPALVFDGKVSYARSVSNFSPQDAFTNYAYTMLFAVRLFADAAKQRVTLMCTDSGVQNAGDYLIEVAMINSNTMVLWVFNTKVYVPIPAGWLNNRAMIIAVRANAVGVEMWVLSNKLSIVKVPLVAKKLGSPPYRPAGFYIGRNNDPGKMNLGRMELLDFAYHPTLLSYPDVTADMNALDSVYGGGS